MSDGPAYRTELGRASAEEGGYFVLSYPEIPGCLGVGDTEAEAVEDGRRALAAVLDARKAVDRPPPEAWGASP
ncbi:MAG: type II toxin-antitoxin system HicB family antitoxin [Hyphomicrobiales bacterium]|nr:MAG: type II toxin-antitoxin system HicB family antitoxin [Hyphomicrobiales bacterium]